MITVFAEDAQLLPPNGEIVKRDDKTAKAGAGRFSLGRRRTDHHPPLTPTNPHIPPARMPPFPAAAESAVEAA